MLWQGNLLQNSVSIFLHDREGIAPLRRCACWAELQVLRARATRDELNEARETGRWVDLYGRAHDREGNERTTVPLGQLATDHVGYCSFDLGRARESLRNMEEVQPESTEYFVCFVTALPVSVAHERLTIDLFQDASLRISREALSARLKLPIEDFVKFMEDLGMLAIQHPRLSDWLLSPASFASSPGALVGRDGCELIMPANLAVQSFRYCQVVRLAGEPWTLGETHGELDGYQVDVRLGLAYEFRTDWFQVGHSLGHILYSLPLAPRETVKLAVIDWSRHEDVQRTDQQKMTEEILHEQNRDRTITEIVKAALREYQSGSSEMFGGARRIRRVPSVQGRRGAVAWRGRGTLARHA